MDVFDSGIIFQVMCTQVVQTVTKLLWYDSGLYQTFIT